MRLDKYLSHATTLTRSQARRAVRSGRLTVNGRQVRDPSEAVPQDARIIFQGKNLSCPGPRYLMMHKPAGYVSVTRDGQHATVLDLVDLPDRHRLHTAGRLDKDTTGLMLITDDGDWSHRVTSRHHQCPKTYRVCLAEPLAASVVTRLREGIMMQGETRPTLPAVLELLTENELLMTLTEGRYHQVKRMFAAVGNHVVSLHRECIGNIRLDTGLAPGQWRHLTPEEIRGIPG